MTKPLVHFIPSAFLGLLTAFAASAQNSPRIGYAFPAGCRQDSQVEVVVGGQFLTGVSNACFSGNGIAATVMAHTKPLTAKERNLLQDRLKELQEKRAAAAKGSTGQKAGTDGSAASPVAGGWTAQDEEMLREIRQKLMEGGPRKQPTPAIAEKVRLSIRIQADAEAGERDLRLLTPLGLSNPIRFCVSQLPETSESEPAPGNDRKPSGARNDPEELRIETPSIINGQILPGDVDRFRFKARSGQQLVCVAKARGLIPYLADAVPGWFQATLAVYDASGKEIAFSDDSGFDPDPVLSFHAPQDGDYVIEIKDSLYRGREDFVYRLKVGDLPHIKTIFPLGAQVGHSTTPAVFGWNLPGNTIAVPARNELGLHSLDLVAKGWERCDPIAFAVDSFPDSEEREPNDRQALSAHIKLPTVVNGTISKPGDVDVYQIQVEAGQQVVLEVQARRLNSALDSILTLQDASGQTVAENDDFEDLGAGLITHQADSRIAHTFQLAGYYYVSLRDRQGKGGSDYGYRLRLSKPQPDFALRISPSTLNFRGVDAVQATVLALRRDGFTNQIDLDLVGPAFGLTLRGGPVPAGKDEVKVTLVAPRNRSGAVGALKLRGRAMIEGAAVHHYAVPADQMVQAFSYRHLVPSREWKVALSPSQSNPQRNAQGNAPRRGRK